jgi:hypothetical protein
MSRFSLRTRSVAVLLAIVFVLGALPGVVAAEIRAGGAMVVGVYGFLVNLAVGAILLVGFPRFSAGVTERVGTEPLRTAGVGLVTLIAVPIGLLLIAVTIIGIPLAIIGGSCSAWGSGSPWSTAGSPSGGGSCRSPTSSTGGPPSCSGSWFSDSRGASPGSAGSST